MILAIIQMIGIFITTWFGTVVVYNTIHGKKIGAGTIVIFAIGVTMTTCGLFL